jgi:hypothetical protein
MKKLLLYIAMLFAIPAAVHAQKLPILRPVLKNEIGIKHLPPVDKSACANCPPGMSCDGPCCMYPTGETIGQLNYIIDNKCKPIKNLHFKFEITKELTAEYDELTKDCNPSAITQKLNTTEGIVIQFNCSSADAPQALIQYLIYIQGNSIFPHIQYAGGTPDKIDHDWPAGASAWGNMTIPKANSLAKGWVLEVALTTDDKGFVNGAKFIATEPNGRVHNADVPKFSLYPVRITEIQTNIVSTNGHYAHYAAGGEGTLSYSSTDELCVEGGNYTHCAAAAGLQSWETCETSNASYGTLSSCCTKGGDSFKQTVSIK